jgi:hypothetical protein
MRLPFTPAQFFDVFRQYNEAVWPAQVGLVVLAFAVTAAITWPRRGSDRFIAVALGGLWLWTGVVYHGMFFSPINPIAPLFGAVSVAGGLAFMWTGLVRDRLRFSAGGWWAGVGYALQAYALLAYPFLTMAGGHAYPAMPTFGLPCPTTIFTVGTLAFLPPGSPASVLVAPVLWSIVGVQAAFLLGVTPDLALLPAGVAALALLVRTRRTRGGIS